MAVCIFVTSSGCGDYEKAVETELDDEYSDGISKRKAAYLPCRMAHPQRYVLDPAIIGTEDTQKSKPTSIVENNANGNPVVHGVDTEGYNRFENTHDLVVLAIGMEPSVDKDSFPVDIVINREGFIEAAPENGGVFAAGSASDAMK
ncbi:MAG: hypothetical protein LJE70_09085 [Chromatiaceae bacterium]|nr:hypothetical protein [Chromatiaceae bacterium]